MQYDEYILRLPENHPQKLMIPEKRNIHTDTYQAKKLFQNIKK